MTRILVIEDESTIREDVCELLQLEGFEALGAEDGISGIQLAVQERPDLIICDIMMPELTGYQVLDAVRSQPPIAVTPFIFLTAKVDRQSMRDGMELGADDFLTKPFTAKDLLGAIRSRLERQARLQEAGNQALEEKRREIIAVLSSELRTPFISLITMQELISRQIGQLSTDELNEMLRALRLGSQQLRYVIEQLVFAAQVETGMLDQAEIHTQGQPTALFQIVATATNLARAFTPYNRDAFVHFDKLDRTTRVWCHQDALRYSIAETLATALNTPQKKTELTISQWQADGFAWIRITVSEATRLSSPAATVIQDNHANEYKHALQHTLDKGWRIAQEIIRLHQGTLELNADSANENHLTIRLPLFDDKESPRSVSVNTR